MMSYFRISLYLLYTTILFSVPFLQQIRCNDDDTEYRETPEKTEYDFSELSLLSKSSIREVESPNEHFGDYAFQGERPENEKTHDSKASSNREVEAIDNLNDWKNEKDNENRFHENNLDIEGYEPQLNTRHLVKKVDQEILEKDEYELQLNSYPGLDHRDASFEKDEKDERLDSYINPDFPIKSRVGSANGDEDDDNDETMHSKEGFEKLTARNNNKKKSIFDDTKDDSKERNDHFSHDKIDDGVDSESSNQDKSDDDSDEVFDIPEEFFVDIQNDIVNENSVSSNNLSPKVTSKENNNEDEFDLELSDSFLSDLKSGLDNEVGPGLKQKSDQLEKKQESREKLKTKIQHEEVLEDIGFADLLQNLVTTSSLTTPSSDTKEDSQDKNKLPAIEKEPTFTKSPVDDLIDLEEGGNSEKHKSDSDIEAYIEKLSEKVIAEENSNEINTDKIMSTPREAENEDKIPHLLNKDDQEEPENVNHHKKLQHMKSEIQNEQEMTEKKSDNRSLHFPKQVHEGEILEEIETSNNLNSRQDKLSKETDEIKGDSNEIEVLNDSTNDKEKANIKESISLKLSTEISTREKIVSEHSEKASKLDFQQESSVDIKKGNVHEKVHSHNENVENNEKLNEKIIGKDESQSATEEKADVESLDDIDMLLNEVDKDESAAIELESDEIDGEIDESKDVRQSFDKAEDTIEPYSEISNLQMSNDSNLNDNERKHTSSLDNEAEDKKLTFSAASKKEVQMSFLTSSDESNLRSNTGQKESFVDENSFQNIQENQQKNIPEEYMVLSVQKRASDEQNDNRVDTPEDHDILTGELPIDEALLNNITGISNITSFNESTALFESTTSTSDIPNVRMSTTTSVPPQPTTKAEETTTQAETTTTTQPVPTTTADPCASQPCDNNARCEQIPGSSDFQCFCTAGFTGKVCDSISDPCLANPCPSSSFCIRNSTDRYCKCSGDFKGEFCNTTDVLITCDGHKSIKHLVLDNPIIECHPSSRSTPNNHCYDPDDNIVFEIEDDPSGIFSVEINSTYYCLKADPGLVNAPVACVNISAKEEDDIVFRPQRMTTFEVCVTFNEPPKITKLPLTEYNVFGRASGDIVLSLSVNDDFGYGDTEWSIAEVSPSQFIAVFQITESGDIEMIRIPLLPPDGQTVSFTVQVDDRGYPPLIDEVPIQVNMVNWFLSCYAPDVIHVQLPHDRAIPVTNISCQTNATDPEMYTVLDASGLELTINILGAVFLPQTPLLPPLRPGTYNVRVSVASGTVTTSYVNFTIITGDFAPTCRLLKPVTEIAEDVANGTCYEIFNCTNPNEKDWNCETDFNNRNLNSLMSIECSESNDNVLLQTCITSSLLGKSVVGSYTLTGQVVNIYGAANISALVEITNVPEPPRFSISSHSMAIDETISPGSGILQLSVTDPDPNERLIFYINETDVPFRVNGSGMIATSGTLNATVSTLISFTVVVNDSAGLKDSANVVVTVHDVNEPPICEHAQATYVITVNATVKSGQIIGRLSCFDTDNDLTFREFQYVFKNNTSSDVTDLFLVNDQGEISLIQDMSTASGKYDFTIYAQDLGGLSTKNDISVIVNRNFPPVCQSQSFTLSLSEKTPNRTCSVVPTDCTDPLGGTLHYVATGNNGTQILEIEDKDNGSLIICNTLNLDGRYGKWLLDVIVNNSYAVTTISVGVTVVDVNDPPRFTTARYEFSVNEKAPRNTLAGQLNAVEPDSTQYGIFNFTIDGGPIPFTIDNMGDLRVNGVLNASLVSVYEFEVEVFDKGGLSAETSVRMNVIDANDPPVCDKSIIQIYINLTTPIGTTLGQIECIDWDIDARFKEIEYSFIDIGNIFGIGPDGVIFVQNNILRTRDDYSFRVNVRDKWMKENNITTGQVSIDVFVNVERNTPPVCSQTSVDGEFKETDPIETCIGKEVVCTDPTGGAVSLSSPTGSGVAFMKIKERATTQYNSIPFNLCVKSSIKNKIGQYEVSVRANTDLGSTTIFYTFTISDINEPPVFVNAPYQLSVDENAALGTSLYQITVVDPDIDTSFNEFNITATLLGDTTDTNIQFIVNTFYIVNVLNSTKNDEYRYRLLATDNGGLSSESSILFNITDINEAPTCEQLVYSVSITVLTPVGSRLLQINCFDTDSDPDNRRLTFISQSDYFNVANDGWISVAKKLPRTQGLHTFSVDVSDAGSPPLSNSVTVNIQVDYAISAVCQPNITYPTKWVIGQCVTIDMNCTDPTLTGTSHLSYSLSGTFSSGFNSTNLGNGIYSFCYKLVINGNYHVLVTVDNQLSPYSRNFSLDVVYDQSTPQFSQDRYVSTVPETINRNTVLVEVLASTPSGSAGNIQYSITGGSLSNWMNYFSIDSSNGKVTSKLDNLRDLVTQTVTLTVQALNDFSQLKSTAQVEFNIYDVNEPPVCSFSNGYTVWRVDTTVFMPLSSLIENITCSDPDVIDANTLLTFKMNVNPNTTQHFGLIDDGIKDNRLIRLIRPLNVTIDSYDITIIVTDGPGESVRFSLSVSVDLLPPAATLKARALNSTTIDLRWSYDRLDYYQVISNFVITSESASQKYSFTAPSDSSRTGSLLINLDPQTGYNITVLAISRYGNISSQSVRVITPAIPVLSTFVVSMKMTGEAFIDRLYDNGSFAYVTLSEKVKNSVKFVLLNTPGFVQSEVLSFRPGSVVVDVRVTINQTGNQNDTNKTLKETVETGWIGNVSVDPNYFVSGSGGGYIRITSLTANSSTIINGTDIALTCDVDIVGSTGQLTVDWFLNTSPVRPPPSSRFVLGSVSPFPYQRQYTLLIRPIIERDHGTYTCQVRDTSGHHTTSSLDVEIFSPPQLAIHPVARSVNYGQRMEIVCTVLGQKNLGVVFKWLVGSQEVTGSDANIETTSLGNAQEKLVIRNVTTRTIVHCEARNIAGPSVRVQSTIDVIKPSTRFCPSSTDNRGTIWDVTVEEAYDVKNCTSGFEGTAIRVCRAGGIWEPPDYTGCVRIDLRLINEESRHLREGIQNQTAESLLGELARLTEDSAELYGSDLDISVDTLDNCVELAEEDEETVTDLSLERFVQSVSNLLDEANILEWEEMLLKERKGASRLMRAVTNYGKVSSKKTQQLRNIKQKNLVVQVGLIQPRDITFPEDLPDWLDADTSSKVVIKKATIDGIQGSQPVGFSSTYYRNMSDLLHKYLVKDGVVEDVNNTLDVNSAVLDVTFDSGSATLNPPIRLEFKHISTNYSKPICGFWDFSISGTPNGAWSTIGCVIVSSTDTETICECDHTTNFAVLMSPGKTPEKDVLALSIISAVGCGVSFIFLLITIIVYRMYWRYVKSDRAIILMNLCGALIASYILFLAGVNRTEISELCTAVAALLHYVLLVVFFLMLGEGIEMAVSILYVFSTRSRIHWLIPLCWVLPAVIVGISLGVTKLEGYGNDTFCWLSIDDGVLYAFVGPALAIIVINFVILILVLRAMFKSHTMLTKSSKEQAKSGVRSMCVILPVIGVTWVFGIFSVNDDLVVFQYLFAIFNSFQGLFIFMFHCLLNRQIKDAIKHNRRRKRSLAEFTTKSTSQVTQKLPRKDNFDRIQNDIEPDINKKENPLWEADKQVKEMVGKTKQGEINNAFDGKEKEKLVEKDNIVSIEDVKISNLIRENSGLPESSASRDESSSSRYRSSDNSSSSRQDGSLQQYDKLVSRDRGHDNLAYRPSTQSSHTYSSLSTQKGTSKSGTGGSSQRSNSSNEKRQKHPLDQKVSSSSSVARTTSTGTGSTYVDLYTPSSSGSTYAYVIPPNANQTRMASRSNDDLERRVEEHRSRLDRVYSFSDKQSQRQPEYKYESRDYDASRVQRQHSSKSRQRGPEHEQSNKREIIYRGKAKDVAAARKQQSSRKDDKKPRDRSKSRDRSYKYAVGYYGGPGIPQHGSLENVSMQYLGYQPFGGIRGQGNVPQEVWDYQVPWHEPRQDYW